MSRLRRSLGGVVVVPQWYFAYTIYYWQYRRHGFAKRSDQSFCLSRFISYDTYTHVSPYLVSRLARTIT